MARKVRVPNPGPTQLTPTALLSPDVEAEVARIAAIENVLLSAEQRTNTNIQSIKTDAQALAYIRDVNGRILANASGTWVPVIGAVFGLLTFLFFVILVAASVLGKAVPPESRPLVVTVLAIGIALSISFLGGTAFVSGKLGNLPWGVNPVTFRAGGGIAVFVIVFIIGYFIYVRNADERVTLTGSVVDVNNSAGISSATIIINTDANTYKRQTTDTGDFRISDIPHLFNEQITVSAKAENYQQAVRQTVVIGSYVQHFRFEMHHCYNGVWHENTSASGPNGNQWHFKLAGPTLHVSRIDRTAVGDFHHDGPNVNWIGELSWSDGKKMTGVILEAPDDASCHQIFTNRRWSFVRDTVE